MSTLYVSEYARPTPHGGGAPSGQEPEVLTQVVVFSSSTQSDGFSDDTTFVRIWADADCRVKFGADPTADGDSKPITAKAAEYFGVRPGHKIAAIDF